MSHFINMSIRGIAKDAHEKFPIRYDVAQASGKSFFIGCRLEAEVNIGNSTITKRMDLRAFEDIADQLAHVQDGDEIEVVCTYDMQKSQKDGKYYPIATVTEVISA